MESRFQYKIIGQRLAKRDLHTYAKSVDQNSRGIWDVASDQGLHILTLVTSMSHIFLAL